jgi:hypothetical protein
LDEYFVKHKITGMKKEFNLHYWNLNNYKLKNMYPQLTKADLIWRHETKDDLFQTIAEKIGVKKAEIEEIIDGL